MESSRLKRLYDLVEKKPSYIRKGQAYFNEAYNINPKLVNQVRGTELDPFYIDSRVPEFIKFLKENNF